MLVTLTGFWATANDLLKLSLRRLTAAHLSHFVLHKWPLFFTLQAKGALFVFEESDAACMASILLMRFTLSWLNKCLIWAVVSPKSKAAPAFCGHAFSWDFYSGTLTDFYWCCSVWLCCMMNGTGHEFYSVRARDTDLKDMCYLLNL